MALLNNISLVQVQPTPSLSSPELGLNPPPPKPHTNRPTSRSDKRLGTGHWLYYMATHHPSRNTPPSPTLCACVDYNSKQQAAAVSVKKVEAKPCPKSRPEMAIVELTSNCGVCRINSHCQSHLELISVRHIYLLQALLG